MDNFKELFTLADKAGKEAALSANVVPMIVGQETYMFSGKLDHSKPTEYVSDGVCGFAWVNVKPGNCKFANWLKSEKLARSDEYYGGVTIWISDYNQSMQRKEAYARAFAKVIDAAKVCKSVYAQSRMD